MTKRSTPVRVNYTDGSHMDFASATDAALFHGTTSTIIHNLASGKTQSSTILKNYNIDTIEYLELFEYGFKTGETIKL